MWFLMMHSNSLRIRNYTDVDYEVCISIFKSNVPTYFAESEEADYRNFLWSSDEVYLVAELNGQIVGCGGYYVTNEDEGRLSWGMVHQDYNRQSIGSTLLLARINALFADDRVTVVGIDTSEYSATFFQRFGFVQVDEAKDGLAPGLHLICMRLSHDDWVK